MRSLRLALVLSAILGVLVGAAVVPAAELDITPETRLAGLPLTARLVVSEPSAASVAVEIWLDGKRIDQRVLTPGEHELSFDQVELASGDHRLEARGGGVSATADFRLLPGWLSIVPPLLAIVLALIFRDVLLALFLGIFGGAMILFAWQPITALGRTIDHFIVPALADSDHASIIIFTTLLGGMVGLITKSGGTHGIIELVAPYATDTRRGQLATWVMGVLVFFDDYANTLIVGPTMRPITDKLRISREKLAYIVDSTAAPVVCLFPISTWVGFEIGLIGDAFSQLDLALDPYTVFVQSIPYRFYPLLALLMVVLLISTRLDFGPMRLAEKRAAERGELLPPDARPIADYASSQVEPAADAPRRAINALLPIASVVVVTVIGLYVSGSQGLERAASVSTVDWLRQVLSNANSFHALLWASLSGVILAAVLPLAQRILKLGEAMGAMVEGFKAMLMALVVLTLAWSLSAVCGELQTAQFMVTLTRDVVSPAWLPALTFVLAAAIAFATGSSWGTMAILEPLVIPICHNLATEAGYQLGDGNYSIFLFGSIASVLSGSVWGDHCSPISDTTILSSMATGCDHIAHVRTQLPYALSVGVLAIVFGCIPAAMGLSPWLALLIGAAILVGGVLGLGRLQASRISG